MSGPHRVTAALAAAGLTLLWADDSRAQDSFPYFGLGGGIGMMDLGSKRDFDDVATARFGSPASSSLDDSTDAWGLQIGYRFNRYVAGEIGFVDPGRGSYVARYDPSFRYSVRFLSSGPTLSVLGMLPLTDRFDIHGRAGVFFSDTRVRERSQERSTGAFESTEPKSSDKDLTLSVGAAWYINLATRCAWSTRASWTWARKARSRQSSTSILCSPACCFGDAPAAPAPAFRSQFSVRRQHHRRPHCAFV